MRHMLEYDQSQKHPHRCVACLLTWKHPPSDDSPCTGKPCYFWQQSPEHLKTYSQLKRDRLKPRNRQEPDAYLYCHKEWFALFDTREAIPRRLFTEQQRHAMESAWPHTKEKYTCQYCGTVPKHLADLKRFLPGICRWCMKRLEEYYKRESDATDIKELAQEILAEPKKYAILDTETTSLTGEPVEVAIIDLEGQTLYHSLIKPKYQVEPVARSIHKITDEELSTAPTLAEAWPSIQRALQGRSTILAYQSEFDKAIVTQTAQRDGLEPLCQDWRCLMKMYAVWFGEWSDHYKSYKWQPLSEGSHRALDDALAALDCLKIMAREYVTPSAEERLLAELAFSSDKRLRPGGEYHFPA